MKIEGGKRGHSNPPKDGLAGASMTHWDYTEEIKRRSRKARRAEAKLMERGARQRSVPQPSTLNQ